MASDDGVEQPISDQQILDLVQQLVDYANRPNPYPILAKLREAGVSQLPGAPVLLVTSFKDCESVLRSPRVSAGRNEQTSGGGRAAMLAAAGPDLPRSMQGLPLTMLDPPDHTRQRGLVTKAFTPAFAMRWKPEIMRRIDDLIDDMAETVARGEHLDVVSQFARPLPVWTICSMIGFPADDIPQLASWSDALLRSIDPMMAMTGHSPDGRDAALAVVELHRYVERLIEQREDGPPRPDILSALLTAQESGRFTDRGEVVRFCVVLMVAGYEGMTTTITNSVLALLRNPDQLSAFRADPSRADLIWEEVLRFDPAVQLLVRTAREPMRIGDRDVSPGTTIVTLLAAANRDPEAFAQPDAFDPDRKDQRHLGFGMGSHYCFGAPLARLQGRLALMRFTQRVQGLSGPELLRYREGVNLRGPNLLRVRAEQVAPRTIDWPAHADAPM